MSRDKASSARNIDWQVKQARFTVYIQHYDRMALEEWWRTITRMEPANINIKSRAYSVVGNMNNIIFAIRQSGFKIDFILQNSQAGAEEPDPMGSYDEAMPKLVGIVKKWSNLKALPSMTRIALGCNLRADITSIDEGYDLIRGHLPNLTLNKNKSKDFTYQINRPIPTETPIKNLIINRLSKWSLTEAHFISFSADQNTVSVGPTTTLNLCQLELDINTSVDFNKRLPKSRISELLAEFIEMGQKIIENGDLA